MSSTAAKARAAACCAAFALALPAAAQADVYETDFEPPVFATGAIVGQSGWTDTIGIDAAVVANGVESDGLGFGDQSLRASNADASGGLAQLRTPALAAEAGEAEATSGPMAGSERHTRFDASLSFGSVVATYQDGLSLHVSPDDRSGRRMAAVRIQDTAGGLYVSSLDPVDNGPGESVDWPDYKGIAADLDRAVAHTLRIAIDYADGPSNDVVRIYVDGELVHTTVSWEQYYRNDPEQAGHGNVVPTASGLLFYAYGVTDPDVPALAGDGLVFDHLSVATSTPGPVEQGPDPDPIPLPTPDPKPPEADGPPADVKAPKLTLAGPRSGAAIVQRGFLNRDHVALRLRCNERCALRASAKLTLRRDGRPIQLKVVQRRLKKGDQTRVALKLTPADRKALRSALRDGKRVTARVVLRVTDGEGNARRVVRRIALRP